MSTDSNNAIPSKTLAAQLKTMRAEVASHTAELIKTLDDPSDVTRVLLGEIRSGDNPGTPAARMRKIVQIIQLLQLHETYLGLSAGDLRAVVEEARGLIALGRITNNASPLSQLPSELELVRSQLERRQGHHLKAAWNSQIAFGLARRHPPGGLGFQALVIGLRAKRLGNLSYANDAFIKAEALGLNPEDLEKARLGRIQALRLGGHREKSHHLSAQTAEQLQLSPTALLELEWEHMCRLVMQNGDPTPMLNATKQGGSHRHATYLLETCLWTRVVSSKRYSERIPKADTIRRQFKDEVKRPARNAYLYECVLGMEKLYDNAHPIGHRLDILGGLIEGRSKLLTLDKEVLLLAAAIRWLSRHHQYSLIEFARSEYEGLSLKMSGGRRRDGLGLVADIKPNPWFYFEGALRTLEFTDQKALALPKSNMGRNLAIAKASLGIAGARISGGIRRLASSHYEDKEKISQREADKIGRIIVRELGALRGPLVKIGQIAALVVKGLPPAIQKALEQMHDSMPPMKIKKIEQVIAQNFPEHKGSPFASLDEHPIAAASIGQIHQGKLVSGEEVAVKVQYPDMESVMFADLKTIRLLRPFYKVIFPSANVEMVIEDTEKSLMQECDYLHEAKCQTAIRDFLQSQGEVYVPQIYDAYTTKRILTMEYIPGLKFYEFLHSAERTEIDSACTKIFRHMLRCFLVGGIYNGDPHPGNYLMMPDGRICFLDFGFSFELPEDRRRAWCAFIGAILGGEADQVRQALQNLGYVTDWKNFDFDYARQNVTAFLLGEGSTKDRSYESYQNVMQRMSVSSKNRKYMDLVPTDLAVPRFFLSLYGFIAKAGAQVDFRRELTAIVAEAHKKSQELSTSA